MVAVRLLPFDDADRHDVLRLRDVARLTAPVPSTAAVADVDRRLRWDEGEGSVIVRHPDGRIGLLMRTAFENVVTGRLGYGRALFGGRTVGELVEPAEILLGDLPLTAVGVEVMARQAAHRLDDLVVDLGEGRMGTVSVSRVLEVTETALAGDPAAARERLTALRAHGVLISLDDFGTGYSSLTYLQQLPFDEVKIDRSFVKGLNGGRSEDAIVAAVIGLGHALDMRVVAEGVEHAHQLERLRSLGCDLASGWHFAAAMPPEQLVSFTTATNADPTGTNADPTGRGQSRRPHVTARPAPRNARLARSLELSSGNVHLPAT